MGRLPALCTAFMAGRRRRRVEGPLALLLLLTACQQSSLSSAADPCGWARRRSSSPGEDGGGGGQSGYDPDLAMTSAVRGGAISWTGRSAQDGRHVDTQPCAGSACAGVQQCGLLPRAAGAGMGAHQPAVRPPHHRGHRRAGTARSKQQQKAWQRDRACGLLAVCLPACLPDS